MTSQLEMLPEEKLPPIKDPVVAAGVNLRLELKSYHELINCPHCDKALKPDRNLPYSLSPPLSHSMFRENPQLFRQQLVAANLNLPQMWEVVRSASTERFIHPPQKRSASHEPKALENGPAEDVTEWLRPLVTALYIVGFSFAMTTRSRIARLIDSSFGRGLQDEAIKRNATGLTEDERYRHWLIDDLHKRNEKRRFQATGRWVDDASFAAEIAVRGYITQGTDEVYRNYQLVPTGESDKELSASSSSNEDYIYTSTLQK